MKVLLACFINLVLYSQAIFANVKTIGPTYPIVEQDFLQWVATTLTPSKQSMMREQLRAQVTQTFDNPIKAYTLPTLTQTQTRLFDPSVRVPHALQDSPLLQSSQFGQYINPLQWVRLQNRLIFIDGLDPKQVAWATKNLQSNDKLIIARGQLKALYQRWHRSIYVDVKQRLAHRFQLQHLPASIIQQGLRLKITEYAL